MAALRMPVRSLTSSSAAREECKATAPSPHVLQGMRSDSKGLRRDKAHRGHTGGTQGAGDPSSSRWKWSEQPHC